MGAEQQVARAQRRLPRAAGSGRSGRAAPTSSGGWASSTVSIEPSARCDADRHRPRRGRAGDDVVGRHQPAQPLSELRQDGGAVGVGEPVGLVEDDDRALSLANQGRQRLVLGADQVVVENEDQQVGPRRQLARFPLAR